MSKKEEEQLLQDASTLLMFANVAAKQQQQHQGPEPSNMPKNRLSPGHSQPQTQPPPSSQPPALRKHVTNSMSSLLNPTTSESSHVLGYSAPSPIPSAPIMPGPTPQAQGLPSISQYSGSQYMGAPTQLKSPPIIHPQTGVAHYPYPYAAPVPPQPLPSAVPIVPAVPAVPAASVSHVVPPSDARHRQQPTSNSSATSSHPFSSLMNPEPAPEPTPHHLPEQGPIRSSAHSSTKSSISNLMNSPEPQPEPKFENKNSPSSNPSPPKAAVKQAQQKSVSPPSTNFPVQGSFGHKRSKSTPEGANKRASFSIHRSPGPANVALARGINLETGERNNNNAVIAAAALAAAADIPLPLKYKERVEVKQETQAANQKPAPIEPAGKNQVPEEENLTEPEIDDKTDDDKTDDESKKDTKNSAEPITKVSATVTAPPSVETAHDTFQVTGNSTEEVLKRKSPEPDIEKVHVESKMAEDIMVQPSVETKPSVKKVENFVPEQKEPEESALPEKSVEVDDFTKSKPPPLESYKIDPDSGAIGCICGIEDDDGFTIQCDICYRWQHCLCMGYKTSDEVPEDEYKCYYCDSAKWGKFDPKVCREETLHRLEIDRTSMEDKDDQQELSQRAEEYNHQQQLHQEQRKKHGQEVAHQQEVLSGKRKSSGSEKGDKKRRVEKDVSESFRSQTSDVSLPGNQNGLSAPAIVKKTPPKDVLPNKDNQLLEEGLTAESYQSIYFNLQTNDYKRTSIKAELSRIGKEFYKSYLDLPKSEQAKKEFLDTEIMSLAKFKALKFSKKVLPNHQKYYSENKINVLKKNKFNKTKIQVKPYTDNQKQKFNGISKLSLFVSSSSDTFIPEGTPIIEYLGEIDLFSNYVDDLSSQYSGWGTAKPKVLKTCIVVKDLPYQKLDIVLDSRFVGNEARFIRKSCPSTANCKIKRIYIPETNGFKFLVVTSEDINLKSESAEEELRLCWEWDSQHPILKMYGNNNAEKFEQLSNTDKSVLISSVDNLLHFTECGCSTSPQYPACAIFKIKKATSYLLRSTRKASSISNLNLTKSKEELILPKKETEFISWNQRLIERDTHIQMDLSVTTENPGQENMEIDATNDSSKVEADKLKDKSNLLFQIPSKQQLMLRSKDLVKSYKRSNKELLKNKSDDLIPPRTLPIPIVSDVVVKIEQSIDDQLKPIIKEVETKMLVEAVDTTEELQADVQKELQVTNDVAAPVVDGSEINVVKNETLPENLGPSKDTDPSAPAPKIVKKLSFADYKKKMK